MENTQNTENTGNTENTENDDADTVREAQKFGFRVLAKLQWDLLKDEYLAYRQNLVDMIMASQDAAALHQDHDHDHESDEDDEDEDEDDDPQDTGTGNSTGTPRVPVDPPAFPIGCLVFLRNIHPDTNKTTIRTLCSQAFADTHTQADGVDYVDFNKGLDSVSPSLFHQRLVCLNPFSVTYD
jgi:hypothetical protein